MSDTPSQLVEIVDSDGNKVTTTNLGTGKRGIDVALNIEDVKIGDVTLQDQAGNKITSEDLGSSLRGLDVKSPTLEALIGALADAAASGTQDTTAKSLIAEAKGQLNALNSANSALGTTADSPASGTQDTTAKSIEALLKGIMNDLEALNAKGFYRCVKEFTRPANITAYAALDCLADNAPGPTTQNLPLAGRVVGGSGTIVRAVMKTDNLSWTNPITIVIYDGAAPGTWIADNAANFDPVYTGDSSNIVGVISFGGFAKDAYGGAGSFVKSLVDGLDMPYKCAADSTNLYYQCFLPSGTPTPASAQKFKLNIGVLRY
jgi:hypothetical protein